MINKELKKVMCFIAVVVLLFSSFSAKAENGGAVTISADEQVVTTDCELGSSHPIELATNNNEGILVSSGYLEDPQGERLIDIVINKVGADNYNIMYGVGIVEDEDCEYMALDSGLYGFNGERFLLTEDKAENLNISGDLLYYSLADNNSVIRAVDKKSGELKIERTYDNLRINQLYVLNDDSFLILSDRNLFLGDIFNGKMEQLTEDGEIINFAPTPYGIIYSKGEVLDYTIFLNGKLIDAHVNEYWTENGAIITKKQGREEKRCLEDYGINSFFNNDFANGIDTTSLQDGWEIVTYDDFMSVLREVEMNSLSETSEIQNEVNNGKMMLMAYGKEAIIDDYQSLVRNRARNVYSYKWNPLETIKTFGKKNSQPELKATDTISGVLYGMPANPDCNASYVFYGCSFDKFKNEIADPNSVLYTQDYSKMAYIDKDDGRYYCPFYSTDCSAFVSYCWGLKEREYTGKLAEHVRIGKVSDDLKGIQVGDALVQAGYHTVLITDINYDAEGKICFIETIEQTPPFTQRCTFPSVAELAKKDKPYANYDLYRSKMNPEGYAEIVISDSNLSLYRGESYCIRVLKVAPGGKVNWSSDRPDYVSVDENGVITCKNAGTAIITAKLICDSSEDIEARCVVTVKKPTININAEKATLYTGSIQNTITLSATSRPSGMISWSSSDYSVAKVDRNGKVSAVGAGSCSISATTNGVSAVCKITVKTPSLVLNKSNITIKKKGSQTLIATATPSTSVAWKSSNTSIATVSSTGVVKGIKKGSVTITATANGISKTCKVTVN